MVAMKLFEGTFLKTEIDENPHQHWKNRWLPALDKFQTKGRELIATMGRGLPFEEYKFCA